MIRSKILGIIAIVLGVLMAIGPFTFAHVCTGMEEMTPMCHATRTAALIAGLVIIIIGLCVCFSKNRMIGKIGSFGLAIMGVAGILVPTVIAPVCKMADMHCHMYTRPFLLVDSIILLCISILFALFAYRKKDNLPLDKEKREG